MSRYIKIPIAVDAVQWNSGDPPLPCMKPGPIAEDGIYYINIRGSWTKVSSGDWIIDGERVDRGLCNPDVFRTIYTKDDQG